MQTKTINIIVRESLLNKGYPIHYYLPFLHHAKVCLENLSLDHNFGLNVKELIYDVSSYDRVEISNDCIDIISVFGIYGGEMRTFLRNTKLTKIYNEISTVKYPWTETTNTLPEYSDLSSSSVLANTASSELPTVFFPSGGGKYEYNVDYENSEVILKPGHGLSTVYMRYLSSVVSTSAANLVNLYAVPVIHAYIEWMMAKSDGSPQSKVALLEDAYYNQKRILRGRMNPLSIEEMYKILAEN
jgi:hypothetical protein